MTRGSLLRQFLGLAGWWSLRVVVGYLLWAFGLLGSALVFGPKDLWDDIGSVAMVAVAYLFWTAVLTPLLVLLGVVQAAVVWAAVQRSGGSRRACAVAGGASATALSVVFVLVMSDPTAWDLVGYVGAGVLVGVLAGWLSARDGARIVRRRIAVDTTPVVR